MFCDQIYSVITDEESKQCLAQAHKFSLSKDFIEAAFQIGKTNDDLVALKHLIRLPHDKVWLEHNISPGNHIGVLAQGMVGSPLEIEMDAWPDYQGSYDSIICFTCWLDQDRKATWLAFPQNMEMDEGRIINADVILPSPNDFSEGEMNFIYCQNLVFMHFLATLNSRNLIEVEASNLERLNRRREKCNKPPLFEYKTLRIKREIRLLMKEAAAQKPHDGDTSSVRAHWRRGHFKVRKTGVFWWSPHVAGKPELGRIEKSYVAAA